MLGALQRPGTTETYLLSKWVKSQPIRLQAKPTLSDYIIQITRHGGYLHRASDPPLRNRVMSGGLSKLYDIHLGVLSE